MFSTLETPLAETAPPHVVSKEARLQSLARKALWESGYRLLGRLECQVIGDVAILSGEVPSYFLKQVAQAVLAAFATVENRVQVQEA